MYVYIANCTHPCIVCAISQIIWELQLLPVGRESTILEQIISLQFPLLPLFTREKKKILPSCKPEKRAFWVSNLLALELLHPIHYKLEILANIFLSCFSNNWYLTGFFKMSLCHRITCDETRHAGCVRTNLSEFLHFLRLRVQASHVLEPVGNLPRQLTSEVHQQPNCCDLKLFLRHSAPVHEPCFPMW